MKLTDDVQTLIQKIYRAAGAPERWTEFLDALKGGLDAQFATLTFFDRSNRFATIQAVVGADAEGVSLWNEKYSRQDPFVHAWLARGLIKPGFVALGTDILPDRDYVATTFYREFGQRFNYLGGLAGVIFADEHVVALVAAGRRRLGQTFGDAEVELLIALMPHLRTALQIHRELLDSAQLGRAALATLHRIRTAAFICDGDGRVVHQNPAADDLLRRARTPLRVRNDRLQAQRPEDQPPLEAALAAAAAAGPFDRGSAHGVTVYDGAGRRCRVIVTGLADHPVALLSRPLAAVLVCRPAHVTASDMARLTGQYHLTPAEARVAQHLLGGGDIASATGRLGTSRETVRTHLRHLFEKTSTHRQPDLLRVLLTSLADF